MVTYTEERIDDLVATIRRDRHRHYSIRVHRGRALAAIFSTLGAFEKWKAAL